MVQLGNCENHLTIQKKLWSRLDKRKQKAIKKKKREKAWCIFNVSTKVSGLIFLVLKTEPCATVALLFIVQVSSNSRFSVPVPFSVLFQLVYGTATIVFVVG